MPFVGEVIAIVGLALLVKLMPAVRKGEPPKVPTVAAEQVLVTVVPVASANAQRATRPLAELISELIVWRISASVRARFQIRTSSMKPPKAPSPRPLEFIAVAMDACWMLSARGLRPPALRVASRLPFR